MDLALQKSRLQVFRGRPPVLQGVGDAVAKKREKLTGEQSKIVCVSLFFLLCVPFLPFFARIFFDGSVSGEKEWYFA
jgi:hypothetical protein